MFITKNKSLTRFIFDHDHNWFVDNFNFDRICQNFINIIKSIDLIRICRNLNELIVFIRVFFSLFVLQSNSKHFWRSICVISLTFDLRHFIIHFFLTFGLRHYYFNIFEMSDVLFIFNYIVLKIKTWKSYGFAYFNLWKMFQKSFENFIEYDFKFVSNHFIRTFRDFLKQYDVWIKTKISITMTLYNMLHEEYFIEWFQHEWFDVIKQSTKRSFDKFRIEVRALKITMKKYRIGIFTLSALLSNAISSISISKSLASMRLIASTSNASSAIFSASTSSALFSSNSFSSEIPLVFLSEISSDQLINQFSINQNN